MSNKVLAWPDGRRVAVLISVLLETWSEGKSPGYFPRSTPLAPGLTDFAGVNWSNFGGKEGVWRLIRILNELGIRGTVFANGRSVENFPDAIAQIVRSGHDIGAHGYLQDQPLFLMTPEGERETIRKSLDVIEKATGKRPTGWGTPIYGWSEHSNDYLIEAGLTWTVDTVDASAPYRDQRKNGSIVRIPWSDFVDNRALRASPRVYFDVYKETFDFLHAKEPGSLLHVAIHSHFGGRPLIAAMFQQILEYLRGFNDVWFPTHAELAKHVIDQGSADTSYRARFFT